MIASSKVDAREIKEASQQFGFAEKLYREGEYYRAVSEYKRLIHFFPQSEKNEISSFMVGFCYFKGEHLDEAENEFSRVYQEAENADLKAAALFMLGEVNFKNHEFQDAIKQYRKVIEQFPDNSLAEKAMYRIGRLSMEEGKWKKARSSLNNISNNDELRDKAHQLIQEMKRGKNLPYKSPVLAGTLAVLPGAGHLYCGRYKDAFASFMLNGLFIAGAVESYRQDLPLVGGILTFFELGWYFGNIYSATNVAYKHNTFHKKKFFEDIDSRLDISLLPESKGLSLYLSMNF